MTHESPHDKAADAVHAGRPVEAQYVRGGRGGVRILTLLVISLAAVAVLLLGMWFLSQGGFARTNANTGAQAIDSAAFRTDSGQAPADAAAPAPAATQPAATATPPAATATPPAVAADQEPPPTSPAY